MSLRSYFFKGHLEAGEEIQSIVHKHWFVIIKGLFKIFLFSFFLPFLIFFLLPVLFWVMILWMVIGLFQILYLILNWYLDAWLLTQTGIVDVKWDGFFKRSTQRIDYKSIEQVSYAFSGIFQTLFHYGTLQIQQPGGITSIQDIENPKHVSAEISRLQELYLSQAKFQDETALKDILTGMIKRHIDKHGVKVDMDEK